MNIMLPLLLIAAFIILVMIVTSLNAKRKIITVKVTHWLLIIYVGVLLLSAFYLTLWPQDREASRETKENWNEDLVRDHFYNSLFEGKVDQLEGRQLINAKNYDYANNTINIEITGYDYRIFVERKDDDDGVIEARVYTDGLIVGGFDFTNKITPVNFRLNDDTLKINYPSHQMINISVARKEFTINQFTGQHPINDVIGDGALAVYLIIPKSLQLQSQVANIQYVNE
ncbi:hypothetical protein [Bacillus sp. FJAT-29937]|uniref:hypothetical protein n=1 Tax=Bacillus sp. FJAT-29937 TaxID=1720553 RepID=UPI00082DBDC0|nr:hypothetical protein [Bacillus sp. FJAT-29937]